MNRYPLPDLLKGFAVFLIIPVHILETFIDSPGRESVFGKTMLFLGGPVAVPVFMMVMGYFVAASKKSAIHNILRGVKIFILGFFLNIGLNFHLLIRIRYDGWQYDPLKYIFGVDIFYLAGLSIVILAVIKYFDNNQKWIALAMLIFIIVTTSFFNKIFTVSDRNYILPFLAGNYSWSYFPLFPWLAYPLLGFIFRTTEHQIMKFISYHNAITISFLAAIFSGVIYFSRFGILTTINLPEYYHHNFWFFLWVAGVDILWILLVRVILKGFYESFIIVFLRWLGKNITVFYIIQWLIIGNTATKIYQTQELSKYGFWLGAIFLITIAITYLYEKLARVLQYNQV